MMLQKFSGEPDEFINEANKLSAIGDTYDEFEIDMSGSDADSTGHIELSENLEGFASFVAEVVEVLAGNAGLAGNMLRGVNQDMCLNEGEIQHKIWKTELPNFDGSGQAVR